MNSRMTLMTVMLVVITFLVSLSHFNRFTDISKVMAPTTLYAEMNPFLDIIHKCQAMKKRWLGEYFADANVSRSAKSVDDSY